MIKTEIQIEITEIIYIVGRPTRLNLTAIKMFGRDVFFPQNQINFRPIQDCPWASPMLCFKIFDLSSRDEMGKLIGGNYARPSRSISGRQ